MALLRLVAGWAERHDHPPIHAATVDHRLRPGSRDEAETVAVWARAIGIAHSILTWDGEKPVTRIQERARVARYGLLAEHAERIGADVLMTAHHADDQAETVLFRLLRGSNIAGLAGMAAVTRRGGLRHARPLLGCSKADLVAVCEAAGQPFLRDPSNEDPRYARIRMRRLSGRLAEEGFGRDAILRLAGRLARAEAALAELTRVAQARLAAERTAESFAARAQDLAGLADEIVLRILVGEMERIGQRPQPPRLERAEALLARLLPALRQGGMFAGTLGGTLIRLDRGRLTIAAEGRRHNCNLLSASPKERSTLATVKISPSLGNGPHEA
jgi:tRNA(Ile)-lysidine synthase